MKHEESLINFKDSAEIISAIRNTRNKQSLPNKQKIEMLVIYNNKTINNLDHIITKLGNLSLIKEIDKKPTNAVSFIVKENEYFIQIKDNINLGVSCGVRVRFSPPRPYNELPNYLSHYNHSIISIQSIL